MPILGICTNHAPVLMFRGSGAYSIADFLFGALRKALYVLYAFFFPLNCFGFCFLAARSTISIILFSLVSFRFASTSHCKILCLSDRLKRKKYSFAFGRFWNSFSKSVGILSASAEFRMVHEPFCFPLIISKPEQEQVPDAERHHIF